jgi:hypothetical protein
MRYVAALRGIFVDRMATRILQPDFDILPLQRDTLRFPSTGPPFTSFLVPRPIIFLTTLFTVLHHLASRALEHALLVTVCMTIGARAVSRILYTSLLVFFSGGVTVFRRAAPLYFHRCHHVPHLSGFPPTGTRHSTDRLDIKGEHRARTGLSHPKLSLWREMKPRSKVGVVLRGRFTWGNTIVSMREMISATIRGTLGESLTTAVGTKSTVRVLEIHEELLRSLVRIFCQSFYV